MKKAFLFFFLRAGVAYGADPFKTLEPGETVLMFGSPLGVVPETTPYSDPLLRVEKFHYVMHPLAMRLDRASREIASSNDGELPVYRISRFTLGALRAPGAEAHEEQD